MVQLRVACAVALALFCIAAPAGAATNPRRVVSGQILAGPVVAASDLVYAARTRRGSVDLWRVTPGKRPKRLAHLGRGNPRVTLAASADAVAVSVDRRVLAAPFGGTLRTLTTRCATRGSRSSGSEADVSVDGFRVAYVRTPCAAGQEVVVADLRDGAGPPPIPTSGTGVRLAGRFVAYHSPGDPDVISVTDLTTGGVAYGIADSGLEQWDMDSEGRLAMSSFGWSGPDFALSYSWGDQSGHYYSDCEEEEIAIDAGRVVCSGSSRGASALLAYKVDAKRPSAQMPIKGRLISPLDLVGSRLAFAIEGCSDDTQGVWVGDVGRKATATPGTAPLCRATIRTRHTRLDRAAKVAVRLSCPTGCRGYLYLRSRDSKQDYGSESFTFPKHGAGTVKVKAAKVRRLLRGKRSVKLLASAEVFGPDDNDAWTNRRVIEVRR